MKLNKKIMKFAREKPEEFRDILDSARHQYVERSDIRDFMIYRLKNSENSVARSACVGGLAGLAAGVAINLAPGVSDFYQYLNSLNDKSYFDSAYKEFLSGMQFDIMVPLGLALFGAFASAFRKAYKQDKSSARLYCLKERANFNKKTAKKLEGLEAK